MQGAEGVHKAGAQQLVELAALLLGVAGVALVLLGAGQVDGVVGNVHVAADHHALLLGQAAEVGTESILPCAAKVDARQLVLGVGGVDADEEELRVLQGEDAALVVELLDANAAGHGKRLLLGKDRRTGVALLLCVVPVLVVALEVDGVLPLLELGLLQGEDVGVERGEYLVKALLGHRAQAVDVPRDAFHGDSPLAGLGFVQHILAQGRRRRPARTPLQPRCRGPAGAWNRVVFDF